MANRNVERRKKRRRRRKVKPKVKLITAVIIMVIALGTYTGFRIYLSRNAADPFGDISKQDIADDDTFVVSEGTAKYKVYDTGKGEAILFKAGDVEALVDTGTEEHADALVNSLQEEITGDLDYLILTSPAAGRVGGFDKVASTLSIKTCVIGELGDKAREIRSKLKGCDKILVGADLSMDAGAGATLSIIKPEVSSSDQRDRSLITYFTFGETGFVALSDAGKEEISRAFGDITDCNVIVLSSYGAEEPNMALSEGNYGVTCVVSADKKSGNPSDALSDHLKGTVVTTYDLGTLEFLSDGSSVELVEKEDEKSEDKEDDDEEDEEEESDE